MTASSTELARTVVAELIAGGVEHLVMAPGSRNAPVSFAALAAERAGLLTVHVRVDERSAGFLALGLAKASGSPVALSCTSGTAVANLHPAMIEADLSGIPLIAVTANRPSSLWGTGANQTIDQVGIFGSAVRAAVHLPAGEARPVAERAIARILAEARGVGGRPGPVQLDLGLPEPLVPDRQSPAEWKSRRPSIDVHSAPTIEGEVRAPRRTLVFIGETTSALADSAVTSAIEAGFPVHIEAGSALSAAREGVLNAGAWLLANDAFVTENRPDHVIVVGRPTLARSLGALLRRDGVTHSVISDHGQWTDPTATATTALIIDRIAISGSVDAEFAAAWRSADAAASATVASSDGFDAGTVARLVAESAPDLLVVASSNPIRDLDQRVPRERPRNVIVNRGAAGIDGLVSTAIGAALTMTDASIEEIQAKCVAFLGDLAFLHDATGLVIGPSEKLPRLSIVVCNNDGGAIFSSLEQGDPQYTADFERAFGTPHGTDLESLCRATGTEYHRVTEAGQLADILAIQPAGIRVIEVPLDRSDERARRRALSARVADTLAAIHAPTS